MLFRAFYSIATEVKQKTQDVSVNKVEKMRWIEAIDVKREQRGIIHQHCAPHTQQYSLA